MANRLERLGLEPPTGGLDETTAPHRLPTSKAWVYKNWLLHYEDRLVARGPAIWQADDTLLTAAGGSDSSTGFYEGIAGFDSRVVFGVYTAASSGTVRQWPWFFRDFQASPAGSPTVADVPAHGENRLDAGAGGFSYREATPSYATAEFESATYGISTYATTVSRGGKHADVVKAHGVEFPATFLTKLYVDGTESSDSIHGAEVAPMGAGQTAPAGGVDVAAYADRLWVAGGSEPGYVVPNDPARVPAYPNRVWFTNATAPGAPADPLEGVDSASAGVYTARLNKWRPDSGADFNYIQIGNESSTDWIVRLIPLTNGMLVLKRNSVWLVTGTGLDSFSVRQISSTDGCVDPRGALIVQDSVFWIGERGVFRYDDGVVASNSQPVQARLQRAIRGLLPTILGGEYFKLLALPNGYVLVQIGLQKVGSLNTADRLDFSYWFHAASGRWGSAEFYTADGAFATTYKDSKGNWWGVKGHGRWLLTDVTDPYANRSTAVRGHDVINSTQYQPIKLDVRFAPARIAMPFTKCQLARVGAEYIWMITTAVDFTGDYLKMSAHRYTRLTASTGEGGNTPVPDNASRRTLLAAATATGLPNWYDEISDQQGEPNPQAQWFDCPAETTDLYVQFTRDTAAATFASLKAFRRQELLGAAVEFQVTHRHYNTPVVVGGGS